MSSSAILCSKSANSLAISVHGIQPIRRYQFAVCHLGIPPPSSFPPNGRGRTLRAPSALSQALRSAHHFASRGDLWIRKFDSMPILILHGDIGSPGSVPFNPVALDDPLEFAPDIIGASEIFVGPNGFSFCSTPSTVPNQPNCIPTSETCITGTVGAPIVDPITHEPLPGAIIVPSQFHADGPRELEFLPGQRPGELRVHACNAIPLQGHSLFVYHNMSHVNGGLGIQNQFNSFVQQNFGTPPSCDGVPTSTGPIPCTN